MARFAQHPSGASLRRQALSRARQALLSSDPTQEPRRDLLDRQAFVLEQLDAVQHSLDRTAAAWEIRDYWLKVERLREKWSWLGPIRADIQRGLASGDEDLTSGSLARLLSKLVGAGVQPDASLGPEGWHGAWDRFQEKTTSKRHTAKG
jgi:hypothetical protein